MYLLCMTRELNYSLQMLMRLGALWSKSWMIAKRSNWICEAVFSYPEDNRLSAKTLITEKKAYEVMYQQEPSR